MLLLVWLRLTLLCEVCSAGPNTSHYTTTPNAVMTKPTNSARGLHGANTNSAATVFRAMNSSQCSAGFYFSKEKRHCVECPLNHISSAGNSKCTKCSGGSLSNIDHTTCWRFEILDKYGKPAEGDREQGLLVYREESLTGIRGTVSRQGFNKRSAVAICRQMGYGIKNMSAVEWSFGLKFNIQSNYTTWIRRVKCTTSTWLSCTYEENIKFVHNFDVFLSCNSTVGNLYDCEKGDRGFGTKVAILSICLPSITGIIIFFIARNCCKCSKNSGGPRQSSSAPAEAQVLDIEVPQPSPETSIPSSTDSMSTLTRTDNIPTYEECMAMSYSLLDYRRLLIDGQGGLIRVAPPSYQQLQEQDGLYGEMA